MKQQSSSKTAVLNFQPRLKSKRTFKNGQQCHQPFPNSQPTAESVPYIGIFTGLSVEVVQAEAILAIYQNGYYGKGSQSRGVPACVRTTQKSINPTSTNSEQENLVLQLEEAFFLAFFLEVLQIQNLDGKIIEWQELLESALLQNPCFVDSLAVYLYLKSKGWIIKSGSKFGGDFIIYKKGPEYFHASFVVYIVPMEKTAFYNSRDLKGIQRVAETSNKDVLLLEITKPAKFQLKSLLDLDKICIAETIIRRLKLSSFVQCPNVNK